MYERMKALFASLVLRRWHPYCWILTAVFFLYAKTLAFKFCYFDDNYLILNNFWFLRDFHNILAAFRQGVFLGGNDYFYRPILTLSFMLDAHLGGTAPLIYHLTNIVIHGATSCLLFALLQRMHYRRTTSFFIAFLFSIHPVLTQAVAWIPGRNDSLLGLFIIASFYFFIDAAEQGTRSSLLFHLFFFVLALFTKETAFIFVPVCMLYWLFFARDRFSARQKGGLIAGWGVTGIVWFVLKHTSELAIQKLTPSDLSAAAPQILPSLLQYVGKAIIPFNLSVFPELKDTSSLYGVAAIVLIGAALALSPGRRRKHILFGTAWFLLFIFPTFIIPLSVHLEHRMYLPIIGLLLILMEIEPSRILHLPQAYMPVTGALLLLPLSLMTFFHADHFINRFEFWESAVAQSPHSAIAHNSLAVRYSEQGKTQLSLMELRQALILNPTILSARVNFATTLMEAGMLADADKHFTIARDLQPKYQELYYNFGRLRFLQGRYTEAEQMWHKSLECNPNDEPTFRALAFYYYLNHDASRFAFCTEVLQKRFNRPFDTAVLPKQITQKWFCDFTR